MSEVSAHFDLTWQFCRALPREDENEEEGGGATKFDARDDHVEIRGNKEESRWNPGTVGRQQLPLGQPVKVCSRSYYPLAFFPALRQVFTSCIRHIIYFTPLM